MGTGDDYNDNNQSANLFRIWTAPNVEEVTINVVSDGTDTDSVKNLNKGFEGTGYSILANQDIEITAIENSGITLLKGDSMPVAASIRFTRFTKQPRFTTMKINILTANTVVQLLVL